jgi:hypothetical protein
MPEPKPSTRPVFRYWSCWQSAKAHKYKNRIERSSLQGGARWQRFERTTRGNSGGLWVGSSSASGPMRSFWTLLGEVYLQIANAPAPARKCHDKRTQQPVATENPRLSRPTGSSTFSIARLNRLSVKAPVAVALNSIQ